MRKCYGALAATQCLHGGDVPLMASGLLTQARREHCESWRRFVELLHTQLKSELLVQLLFAIAVLKHVDYQV